MSKTATLGYIFGPKHIAYMRACKSNLFNVAEGAVRAGKTVDNVFVFADELEHTPDRIHLATGSTMANAKLNIGDCNGFGLEYIFRGRCKWGKFKGNECLYISTADRRKKVVIFAGGGLANSFKKIRGNSYGMWIATEINLHHENTIKEATNRQLAAKHRKIFWDLNPENPNAPIYRDFLDKYQKKQEEGAFVGGYNYQLFTIRDNATVTPQRLAEIESGYDPGSVWYRRDILGQRCAAEGLVYQAFADCAGRADNPFRVTQLPTRPMKVVLGVDFGGTGSGHAFVATAIMPGYSSVYALCSERHFGSDIDPEKLGNLFVKFVERVEAILEPWQMKPLIAYCDSAESVLIRGLQASIRKAGKAWLRLDLAAKTSIIETRVRLQNLLIAQGRFFYLPTAQTLETALSTAVYSGKDPTKDERLDDGSSDIDTMDAYEYTIERDYKRFIQR